MSSSVSPSLVSAVLDQPQHAGSNGTASHRGRLTRPAPRASIAGRIPRRVRENRFQGTKSDSMREFPSGTVTFLFTDVEGSTRRWEQNSVATRVAIERHFLLLDDAIHTHNGVRFKTVGDAIYAAFPSALDAVLAAVAAQRALIAEDWGTIGPVR